MDCTFPPPESPPRTADQRAPTPGPQCPMRTAAPLPPQTCPLCGRSPAPFHARLSAVLDLLTTDSPSLTEVKRALEEVVL